MPNRQADPDAKVRYLVHHRDGDFVIEISAKWKVTFGAVNPGAGNMARHDLHCMRVWEGEKLRAVFENVSGFRDLSIPMARKQQAEVRTAKWEMDSAGNFEQSEKRALSEPTFTVDDSDFDFASNGSDA
jgi:hypothetical protein